MTFFGLRLGSDSFLTAGRSCFVVHPLGLPERDFKFSLLGAGVLDDSFSFAFPP